MILQSLVGEMFAAFGSNPPLRADNTGALITSDAHGRFAEAARNSRLFSAGMALTAINNATFTSATVGATATPLIGLWNPLTSTVQCEILQATLGLVMSALQATGCGPFVWMSSVQNGVISTGITPFNRRTLVASGSQAKAFAGTALTGLTNNLAFLVGSALYGGSSTQAAFLATQAGLQTQQLSSVENLDGSLIIPPGGVIALMATGIPVGHSAVSGLLWEERPLQPF